MLTIMYLKWYINGCLLRVVSMWLSQHFRYVWFKILLFSNSDDSLIFIEVQWLREWWHVIALLVPETLESSRLDLLHFLLMACFHWLFLNVFNYLFVRSFFSIFLINAFRIKHPSHRRCLIQVLGSIHCTDVMSRWNFLKIAWCLFWHLGSKLRCIHAACFWITSLWFLRALVSIKVKSLTNLFLSISVDSLNFLLTL